MTRLRGILTSTVHRGEWRTWAMKAIRVAVRRFLGRTMQSIDFVQWSGYKQNYRPKNAHGGTGKSGVALGGVSHIRRRLLGVSPEDGGGEVQRPGRMRLQQLSWQHSAETDHPRRPERVQHLGRAG